MKKFKVDRSKWRCGDDGPYAHGEGETQLLNEEGFMCCLGYCLNQLKVPKKKLKKVEVPEQVEGITESVLVRRVKMEEKYEYLHDSALTIEAITTNDQKFYTREEREAKLSEIFKKHGQELVFTGKYTDEL